MNPGWALCCSTSDVEINGIRHDRHASVSCVTLATCRWNWSSANKRSCRGKAQQYQPRAVLRAIPAGISQRLPVELRIPLLGEQARYPRRGGLVPQAAGAGYLVGIAFIDEDNPVPCAHGRAGLPDRALPPTTRTGVGHSPGRSRRSHTTGLPLQRSPLAKKVLQGKTPAHTAK